MVPQPCKDRKTPTTAAAVSEDCKCRCPVCHARSQAAEQAGHSSPLLTWHEQTEALALLHYWWEHNRGGLPMDEAVVLFTKTMLDKHAART